MLAAMIVLAAAPGVAAQSPSPEPTPPVVNGVKITDCTLEYNAQTHVAAKLHIDFVNLNDQAVTHIRFRIRAGFQTFPVMDIGNFAPDLKIHHDLDPPETAVAVVQGTSIPGAGDLDCSVDAFTLADGYTWISPELQAELDQQKQH
jgi:hypothetical protein